jgi:hypothetical protein
VLFPARDLAAVRPIEAGIDGLVPVHTLHGQKLRAPVLLRADGVLGGLGKRLVDVIEPLARLLGIGEGASRRVAAERPGLESTLPAAAQIEHSADAACGSRVLPGDDPQVGGRLSRVAGPAAAAAATAGQ